MKVNAILFCFLCYASVAIAADDSDDFSLDSSGGLDSNAASHGDDVIDDSPSGSDLFGDSIPEERITNTPTIKAQTESQKPKSSPAPAAPHSVSQPTSSSKPPSLGVTGVQINKPANAVLAPPGVPALPGASGAGNVQLESGQGASATATSSKQAAPQAPLNGDGSVAPVKQDSMSTANEFGGVPPLPGTRRDMAPGEAPEVYSVEEGDTMFDVCSQLIDDGNYWPKLWSLNPEVRNPHFIYPGMKLAFYSGDQETPPYLEVVAEDEVVPVEKGEIKEVELVSEPVSIPTSGQEGASTQVVAHEITQTGEESPTSIVNVTDIGAESDGLDGFIFAGARFNTDDISIVVPAFVFEDEPEQLATVVGGPSGESGIGEDKKVFLEAESDELGVGTYTILRPSGDVDSLRTGSFVGYRYEFAGNVRVTRKTKKGLLEGLVFDARDAIKEGDIVVNFIATKRSIAAVSAVGPVAAANSSVIGFQDAGRTIGGKGDLVLLEKQGLSVGGYYAIFRTAENRPVAHSSNSDVQEDSGSIAVARVIEISGASALGYIVQGSGEVRLGDSLSL